MSAPIPRLFAEAACWGLGIILITACADDADTVMGTNRASGSDASSDAADTDEYDAGTAPDAQAASQPDASAQELDAQADANKSVSAMVDAQPHALDAMPFARATVDVDGATREAGAAVLDTDAASPNDGLAEALLNKLRTCGIVGTGEHHTRPVLDAFDGCRTQCELDASCAALSSSRCSGQRDQALEICLTACTTAPRDDGFACGTRRIRRSWVCDGVQHCAGREDESSCLPTSCADGTQVSKPAPLCDGVKDCADGSDELSCAPYCV